jgi:hypothetical protein
VAVGDLVEKEHGGDRHRYRDSPPTTNRMIGRVAERRSPSTKPARRNAAAVPVHAKASGITSSGHRFGVSG